MILVGGALNTCMYYCSVCKTKVTVFNVGLHATCAQLEKLLAANGIEYKKAKKPPSISHAVLAFEVSHGTVVVTVQYGTLL